MKSERECPECGENISESYQPYEPDVGILAGGWYCEACDLFVAEDDFDEEEG